MQPDEPQSHACFLPRHASSGFVFIYCWRSWSNVFHGAQSEYLLLERYSSTSPVTMSCKTLKLTPAKLPNKQINRTHSRAFYEGNAVLRHSYSYAFPHIECAWGKAIQRKRLSMGRYLPNKRMYRWFFGAEERRAYGPSASTIIFLILCD